MLRFKFDKDKAVAMILYISQRVADLYTLLKIIYFAEQKHIKKYGMPILGDNYIAMEKGPVPSTVYDMIKIVRGDNTFCNFDKEELTKYFSVENGIKIISKEKPNMKHLAESDLECINESIAENKSLRFEELIEKSHDDAWKQSDKNDDISYEDIAKAAGASQEMIERLIYISENEMAFNQ